MNSVLIIYTGGTIGMVKDHNTGSLVSFNFDALIHEIPEIKKFDLGISTISIDQPIDSSDMQPDNWVNLAEIIFDNYGKYDGFVILHGSDTMSYTASALSFMLENLDKPVILTGSQLPIGAIRTDAKENLLTAIEIASMKDEGKAVVPEVAIYFEYNLYRGNRSKKVSAEEFAAFQSPNYPLLAEAGVNLKFNSSAIQKSNNQALTLNKDLDLNVATLKLFPGISKEQILATINIPHLKAIVLETYGSGNTSSQQWFSDLIGEAIQKGIIVLNISQCLGGSVELGKYESSGTLGKIGVISGKDMLYEAAVTKLMHLLGKGLSKEEVKQLLQQSLRGEITSG